MDDPFEEKLLCNKGKCVLAVITNMSVRLEVFKSETEYVYLTAVMIVHRGMLLK